jgi:hypothetical protein
MTNDVGSWPAAEKCCSAAILPQLRGKLTFAVQVVRRAKVADLTVRKRLVVGDQRSDFRVRLLVCATTSSGCASRVVRPVVFPIARHRMIPVARKSAIICSTAPPRSWGAHRRDFR